MDKNSLKVFEKERKRTQTFKLVVKKDDADDLFLRNCGSHGNLKRGIKRSVSLKSKSGNVIQMKTFNAINVFVCIKIE